MTFASIRFLLAILTHFDLKLVKIDVKTTICEGELDEGIYIKQYSGFEVKKNEHKLCHLKRPLYPLK